MYNYPKYQSYDQTYNTGYSNQNFLNKLKEYANRQRYYDTMYGGNYVSNDNYGYCPNDSYNNPNCYMTFNGQNLGLYNNMGQYANLDAQSGHRDYQSSRYQNVANKGPLPEGIYYANQDQRQNISLIDSIIGFGKRGKWPGSIPAWGINRVWLQPDENTDTYGRSGFTIHGGLSKGSAGCIDIPWQTGKLNDYLDDCQESVPVYVKYPNNW